MTLSYKYEMRNTIDLVSGYPTTLYYSAPSSERETILMLGLRAEGDGIFFDEHVPDRKPEIDVWEVDARGLPIYSENDVWVDWTDTVIPPNRLNLLSDRIDEKTVVEKSEPIMEAWFGPALLWRNAMTKWLETQPSDGRCSFEMLGSSRIYIDNVGNSEIMKQMCSLADRYQVSLSLSLDGKRQEAVDRYATYGFSVNAEDNTMVREPQAEVLSEAVRYYTGFTHEPSREEFQNGIAGEGTIVSRDEVIDDIESGRFKCGYFSESDLSRAKRLAKSLLPKLIISEAPIEDISHIGDWDKSSSFNHAQDRKLLTNPKAISKIKAMWKYPDDVSYNVVLVNNTEGRKYTEVGIVGNCQQARAWFEKNMPKTAPDISKYLDEQSVNIIYTNNSGSERVPMTGWVMAHRYSHAMFRAYMGNQSYYLKEAASTLSRYIGELAEQYGVKLNGVGYGNRDHNALLSTTTRNLLTQLCTFRSARDNNLRNSFEALHELFAQYIITGKVTFNDIPQIVKVGNSKYYYQGGDDYDHDNRAIKEDLASELTEYFEAAVHYSVGKVLVM